MGCSLARLPLRRSLSQNWLLLSVRTYEQPYLLDEGAPSPKWPKIDTDGKNTKIRATQQVFLVLQLEPPCNAGGNLLRGRALPLKPNHFPETNMETNRPHSSPRLRVLALFFFFFYKKNPTRSAKPVWSCPAVAVGDNLLETLLVYTPHMVCLNLFSPRSAFIFCPAVA